MTLISESSEPAPATIDLTVDGVDRSIETTVQRIARDLADVPADEVRVVLTEFLDATRDARVQNFRLLLAERQTRRRLGVARGIASGAAGRTD